MTRRWIVRPLAQADLDDAATWYESQQSGWVHGFSMLSITSSIAFVKPLCNSLPFPLAFDERYCRRFRTPCIFEIPSKRS